MNITLDRRSNVLAHLQISSQIRQLILGREIYVNRPLPEPIQLAKTLAVDVEVIEKAYAELIYQELIRKDEMGRYIIKYLVAPKGVLNRYVTIVEGIRAMGFQPVIKTIKNEVVLASKIKFYPQSGPHDKLVHIERVYYADLKPIAFVDSYFSLTLFPNLDKLDMAEHPYTDFFKEHYSVNPRSYVRTFYADVLNDVQSQLIHVESNAIAMVAEMKAFDEKGLLVEFSQSKFIEHLLMEFELTNPRIDHFY